MGLGVLYGANLHTNCGEGTPSTLTLTLTTCNADKQGVVGVLVRV